MNWKRLAVPVALALTVAACRDESSVAPTQPNAPRPQLSVAQACTATPTQIRSRLRTLYPTTGGLLGQALTRFGRIEEDVNLGRMTSAVTGMFRLVDWTLQNFRNRRLVGAKSDATQREVSTLIDELHCYVQLPAPAIRLGSLGSDAAVAVVYPSSPDTVIKTATDWAAVAIPAGAIPGNQPVLITIQRIPESQYVTPTNPFGGPLFTSLNQYPLFYEYSVSPNVTFTVPVTIGICLQGTINLNTSPGSRLRVAHNVGATIEVLPLAVSPPLSCGSIVTASAGAAGPTLAGVGGWRNSLRLGFEWALDVLSPPSLHAAAAGTIVRGTCCLGGTTRTFSPFAAVDTLGFLSAQSATNQSAPAGTPVAAPPRVRITTDPLLGATPIPGIPVTFTITAGTGTLNGGPTTVVATTDANGEAFVSSWVVSQGVNQVVATPTYVPGTGFTPASVTFDATGTLCQSQTQIPALQCNALATLYTSTNGASWTTSTGWLQTSTPCSWYGVTCLGGLLTDINLPNNNLTGTIPAEIGDLTDLQWLNLSSNQLTGSIPANMGNLTALQFLQLQSNQLSGPITAGLGNLTGLLLLALEQNQLSGAVPTSIGNLTALQILNLSTNQLTGTIPASLGSMTSLQQLYLYSNQLSGTVPLAVATRGGLIQGTLAANQPKCQFQGNVGLHVPDQTAYRAADLNADGSICGLAFTTVATVTVTPAAPTMNVSASLQFTATLQDGFGNVLSGPVITWNSTNSVVATVTATGLVTAVAPGTASIRATAQSVIGATTVTVIP